MELLIIICGYLAGYFLGWGIANRIYDKRVPVEEFADCRYGMSAASWPSGANPPPIFVDPATYKLMLQIEEERKDWLKAMGINRD